MRSLVIGACGFLGRSLTRELSRRHQQVRTIDTNPHGPIGSIDHIQSDVMSSERLHDALNDVDVVYNFISTSIPSSGLNSLQSELQANTQFLVKLVDRAADNGVRKIVFPSSGGTVYGDSETDETLHRETDPLEPRSVYALGKVLGETTLKFYCMERQIGALIVRIANPYGNKNPPAHAQGVVDHFVHRVVCGKPLEIWGDGECVRDFIHIDDVVQAVADLAERPLTEPETYNVGSGVGATVNDVAKLLQAHFGELKVSHRDAPAPLLHRNVLCIAHLRAALPNWKPRLLSQGIADFVTDLGLTRPR